VFYSEKNVKINSWIHVSHIGLRETKAKLGPVAFVYFAKV